MDGLKASYIMHVSADTSTPPCLKIWRGAESTAGYCSSLFTGDRSYNIHTYIPQESTHTQHTTHACMHSWSGRPWPRFMNENLEQIFWKPEHAWTVVLYLSISLAKLPIIQRERSLGGDFIEFQMIVWDQKTGTNKVNWLQWMPILLISRLWAMVFVFVFIILFFLQASYKIAGKIWTWDKMAIHGINQGLLMVLVGC